MSILNETKQVLGIHKDAHEFDLDIVMHINSAFFKLMQLGVGPENGYAIENEEQVWLEFVGSRTDLAAVKSFVFVEVRLLFDRPETSYGIQALERIRDEFAWRLELQGRIDTHE